MRRLLISVCCLALLAGCGKREHTAPAVLRIAVASNFAPTLQRLVEAYSSEKPVKIQTMIGSTGLLYAQIDAGAPYDLFFSADSSRPAQLAKAGKIDGLAQSYALGRLVLWGPSTGFTPVLKRLQEGEYSRLAIANPELAPFGAAANEVLQRLELQNDVVAKLVRGENIGQVYQYVRSGRVDMGFIALSQALTHEDKQRPELLWRVPADMHAPILQQAVVLKGEQQAQARAFLAFCLGKRGRAIIRAAGYALPEVDFVDD